MAMKCFVNKNLHFNLTPPPPPPIKIDNFIEKHKLTVGMVNHALLQKNNANVELSIRFLTAYD